MMTLFEQGKIFVDSDFMVKHIRRLKTDKGTREFKEKHPILLLRLPNFVSQYKQLAQREGEKKIIMDKDSIKYYLTTCSAYLGENKSVRFVVMKDGVPVTTQEPVKDSAGHIVKDKLNNPIMQPVKTYSFGRFMCFDYVQLSQRYGLRLESFSASEADRIELEDEEDDGDSQAYKEGEIF